MTNLPIPVISALRKLGQDINDARRRRRISAQLMAQRAGLSRSTIGKIEKGEPTTSMGSYGAVLFVLGMEKRMSDLVDSVHDIVGRRLEDEHLPKRVRMPNKINEKSDDQ
ncbi:helix-turn-helix domain-containing protein [Rickettsiales endosymbiont of Peranema trichophorum]|uniref:helix-turn-helix domain-containing protein n=1 Tax=Rickettsiales endosymbiont of Peranema trichophorum TaxID=2486577 RepID=UPI001023C81D|nr:helix-turn-helix domain-containing protein [Rickettsiales endosymbiont of Peranema trichophorum]RZI45156.1 helix-turn-helix domain-containing protein [Rickettsiales endosymbiont of Peranema trichophorum]